MSDDASMQAHYSAQDEASASSDQVMAGSSWSAPASCSTVTCQGHLRRFSTSAAAPASMRRGWPTVASKCTSLIPCPVMSALRRPTAGTRPRWATPEHCLARMLRRTWC